MAQSVRVIFLIYIFYLLLTNHNLSRKMTQEIKKTALQSKAASRTSVLQVHKAKIQKV